MELPKHCRRNHSYLFQTVVSNHCGCTPRGIRGVKRPEIVWEIQKPSRNSSKFLKKLQIVVDFTQFWLDGRPGNEYFWISHKIFGLLTPLTPLDMYPQCLLKIKSETDWSNSSQCATVAWIICSWISSYNLVTGCIILNTSKLNGSEG